VAERGKHAEFAGIPAQHVESPPAFPHRHRHPLDGLGGGQIDRHQRRLPAEPTHRIVHLLERALRPPDENDVRPLLGEAQGDGAADAVRRPGHQGEPAGEATGRAGSGAAHSSSSDSWPWSGSTAS
jgi:hypothetical protein